MRRLVLAFVVVPLSLLGCTSINAKDFNSWCEYIHHENKDDYDVFSIDREAVKRGVVAQWDTIIVQNSVTALGIAPESAFRNSVMLKMRKIGMAGAIARGDTVYFGLGLITPDRIQLGKSSADLIADRYKAEMDQAAQPNAEKEMDAKTYCLYSGLDVFFDKVVVRTSDGTHEIVNELYRKLKNYERRK